MIPVYPMAASWGGSLRPVGCVFPQYYSLHRPVWMQQGEPSMNDLPSPEPDKKSWVFFSNPASIQAGTLSLLAVLETVVAVAVYWLIAWKWETHLHLLVSTCIAPLLLLRSDTSVQEGVEWFDAYTQDGTKIRPTGTPVRFWGIVSLSATIAGLCVYMASHELLLGHAGWSLFGRAFLLGGTAFLIAVAVAGAVAIAVAGAGAGVVAVLVAGAVAGAGTGAVAGVGAVAGAVAVAVAVAVVGAVVGAVAGTGAIAGAIAGEGLVIFFIPLFVGVLLRSLAIRFTCTLRHLPLGLQAMPNNWWQILMVIDLKHPPEILPGLDASHKFSFLTIRGEAFSKQYIFNRITYIIILIIWFPPALLYRWSLKSTCWLYWPLVYLSTKPRWNTTGKTDAEIFLKTLHTSRMETLRRWTASAVLVSALVSSVSGHWNMLGQPFAHMLILVHWVRFDLTAMAPWQWCALLGAIITVTLFFFSDRVKIAWETIQKTDPQTLPVPHLMKILHGLVKVRNISTWIFLSLAVGYVYLAVTNIDPNQLPGWLFFLKVLYGDYLPLF